MDENEKKERRDNLGKLRVLVLEICKDLSARGEQDKSDSLALLTGFAIGAALKAEG